ITCKEIAKLVRIIQRYTTEVKDGKEGRVEVLRKTLAEKIRGHISHRKFVIYEIIEGICNNGGSVR
ncbi:hypothetical protein CGJ15_27765, partial [Vibrio parahaemolyticus]